MLIDWFTVGAQILNFIVLVWLLKRFLYKPILAAVDAREKKIASALADADTKKAEAKTERDAFAHKNEVFDDQRADLLAKATDAANTERQKLLAEANQAADDLTAKRRATMLSDAASLNQAVSRRAQDEVFAISRKVLSDLATANLEASLGDVFIRKLLTLDAEAKARFGKAIKATSEATVVRSAFTLPTAQRKAIQEAINTAFSSRIEVQFETAPDLIGGIELTTTGEKISWSIADYLKRLETGVRDIMSVKDSAGAPEAPDHKPPRPKSLEPKREAKPA